MHHRFTLRPQMSNLLLRKQTKLKAVKALKLFLFKKIEVVAFSLFLVGYITLYSHHMLLARVEGLKLSNSLNTEIRNASSIAEFTSKLKSSFTVIVYFTSLSVLVCAFFFFSFFCLPLLLRPCAFSFALTTLSSPRVQV